MAAIVDVTTTAASSSLFFSSPSLFGGGFGGGIPMALTSSSSSSAPATGGASPTSPSSSTATNQFSLSGFSTPLSSPTTTATATSTNLFYPFSTTFNNFNSNNYNFPTTISMASAAAAAASMFPGVGGNMGVVPNFDATIKVLYKDDETHKQKEEIIFSHKHILAKTQFFQQQIISFSNLTSQQSHHHHHHPFSTSSSFQLFIDLTMIPDALNNFRALLMLLYTGNINSIMTSNNETLLTLAKLLQIPEFEEQIRILCESSKKQQQESQNNNNNNNFLSNIITSMANNYAASAAAAQVQTQSQNSSQNNFDFNNAQSQLYNLYAQYFLQSQISAAAVTTASSTAATSPSGFNNNNFGGGFSSMTPTNLPSPLLLEAHETASNASLDRSPTDSTSMIFPPSTPPDSETNEQQLIVSNDKEGWCRNKKYIENVPNGYRCTVCRKVYGRYNSVSYHVTIYHRNPPIRCGVEGCPFTTREARYIHFHKYYRHGIKLPESIDLASRKCPYCRHISKSPAMLEKHICRHVQDCLKNGKSYTCLKCNHESKDQKNMYEHLREHQLQAVEEEIKATKQAVAGVAGVEQPTVAAAASASSSTTLVAATERCDSTKIKFCEYCKFTTENEMQLQQHKIFNHTSKIFDSTNMTNQTQTTAMMNPLNTLLAWQQFLINQSTSNNSNLLSKQSSSEANDAEPIIIDESQKSSPLQVAAAAAFINQKQRGSLTPSETGN